MKFSNSADKIIISRANDTVRLSQKHHCSHYYGFLNEHEARVVSQSVLCDVECIFYGGYDNAQRVMFGANVTDVSEFPIKAAKFTYKKEYKLSHRDFLGALMSLKIDRTTVGDILVGDGETTVFFRSEIYDFVTSQLSKIGSVGVTVSRQDMAEFSYAPDYDVINLTVSSLRLDAVVSAVCNVSRDKSQRLIKSELVAVNHSTLTGVSKVLEIGDVITIRKFGKFVFTEHHGLSKKDKHKISVKHFR